MRNLISNEKRLATAAVMLLLAGCATTPAPVVNHSFGPGQPGSAPVTPAQPAASSGTQTFGLGHANGTVSAAGYTVAPGDTLYSVAFAHGLDFRALAARNGIPSPYVIHPGQVLKLDVAQPAQAPGTVASGTTITTMSTTARGAAAPKSTAPTQPAAPVFGPVTTQPMAANGVAPGTASSAAVVTTAPAAPVNLPSASAPAVVSPPAQPFVVATPAPPPEATRNVAGIIWRWPAAGKVIDGFQSGSGGDGAGLDIAGKPGEPVRAAASGTVVYSGNGLIGYGELVIIKHNDTYLSAYGHNSKRLVKEGEHVDAGQEIALMGASGAPRVELHFEIRKNGKPVDPMGFLPQR